MARERERLEVTEVCVWPALAEPYLAALGEAVAFVFERFVPVGILATGTIVRGNPRAGSDLDIQVVHDEPWRQRVQRRFNGVPAEVFVNPPWQVARYVAAERGEGRPVTAHMFATGFVVYDPEGVVAGLRAEAAADLARGPEPSERFLLAGRYAVANWFEDALDVAEADAATCAALLCRAVDEAVRFRFREARRWQPRPKDAQRELAAIDAEMAADVRRFFQAHELTERLRLARRIVAASAGATGFFEWESEKQDAPR